MRRWQYLLSFYLIFTIAFAGVVGISPTLHFWVEHGGDGHVHSHAGSGTRHAHSHAIPSSPFTAKSHDLSERLEAKYPQPRLFGLELKQIYRALVRAVAPLAKRAAEAPSHDRDGHAHDSLAQMLLAGAVEGLSIAPLLVAPLINEVASGKTRNAFVPGFVFNSQTASRAPPARR
jgi:hypothetical protein